MRSEVREADRRFEVVRAAEAWHDAGAIDVGELAAIRARHADDRQRTKPAFRVLFFAFSWFGGLAAWGFLFALLGGSRSVHGVALLVATAACALGAEAATGRLRLRRFGVEEALVALGLAALAGGVALLGDLAHADFDRVLLVLGVTLAAASSAAALRWGTPLTGALAAGMLLLAAFQLPGARWLWLGLGIAIAVAADRWSADPATAAAHRRRLEEAAVAGWLATYVAVHAEGVRHGLFEDGAPPGSTSALGAAWAAMFALPAVLLVVGLRRRDRIALGVGATLLAVSCGGAADALDLEPLWLVLLGAGLVLLAVALAARAAFARAPARALGGFTDGPLYEGDRHSALELAAAVAVFTPEPRREADPEGFRGGGGEFGGGGASSKF